MLRKVRLVPNQHCFTRGFQHRISKPWVCPNATWVTFLGNQQAKRCAALFLTQLSCLPFSPSHSTSGVLMEFRPDRSTVELTWLGLR